MSMSRLLSTLLSADALLSAMFAHAPSLTLQIDELFDPSPFSLGLRCLTLRQSSFVHGRVLSSLARLLRQVAPVALPELPF